MRNGRSSFSALPVSARGGARRCLLVEAILAVALMLLLYPAAPVVGARYYA